MRSKWIFLICLLVSSIAKAQQAPPVLFFSDLTWGPNTGWNNGSTQGAAVTVWGKNLGSTQGSSYITVNGANATNYAEWDVMGPARGLERITFWIPTGATSGAGTITVTVNGVTSNSLSFTVASATIYYIDVTNGNNANNGLTTSTPFKDIYMCNPGLDNNHSAGQRNPSGDGQYICYVRGGTYTTGDVDGYFTHTGFLDILSFYGSPTKQKAVVAYPGEVPILSMDNHAQAIIMPDALPSGATCCGSSYWTFSKLVFKKVSTFQSWAGSAMITMYFADHFRIIGNTIQDLIPPNQVYDGIIFVGDSSNTSIYGNYWNHNGFDSYDHGIYVKTQDAYTCCSSPRGTINTDIGWNEFNNGYASDTHGGQDIFVSHASSPSPASYPTDNTWIHHNYFHDGNTNFFYVGDNATINGSVYLYGNIFKGGPPAGTANGPLITYCGGNNVYFYNNTIYSPTADNAIWTSSYSGCSGGPSLLKGHYVNNLWDATVNGQIWIYEDTVTSTFDHELYWEPDGNPSLPSASGVTVTNPTKANPQLVNPGTDYHLQSNSGAHGIGTNLASSMTSLPWGLYDYDGVAYPASGAWDVGALQYGAAPPRPNPPTNLTVTVN